MKHVLFKSMAYTRFNISDKGILWTKLDDGFTPSIIEFFSERFPLLYIMIEYQGKTYVKKKGVNMRVYYSSVNDVLKRYEDMLPINNITKDLAVNDASLWETFYESQYVKERRNTKLFYHWIPKYLKGVKALSKEFSMIKPSRKISEFL